MTQVVADQLEAGAGGSVGTVNAEEDDEPDADVPAPRQPRR